MTEPAATQRRLAAAQRYVEIGRPHEALEALGGLDAEAARTPYAVRLRGFAHFGAQEWDEAAEVARDGLEDEPEDEGLLYLLSLAEEQRGDLAAAEGAILAALAQESEQPELLAQYADVLMRAGQLDKAGQVLGHAAAGDPDSPDVLGSRISLAYLRHDRRGAQRLTGELLAMDPESRRAHRMLGALALERGKPEVAEGHFGQAVRSDPSDHQAAGYARASRLLRNPLWWPSVFFDRFGVAATWVGAMLVIFGLRGLGLDTASAIATGAWLLLCVWSWIATPLLNRRLKREGME